ncbi:hypothetical protein [Daejeonia sp. YH14]|uniref:hypothetical protein n=1 Tax=Daejeonia sp. YH14 TaxID=3439042 RepID=UPI003F495700
MKSETIEKPLIAEEILASLQVKIQEEKQVIVHCCFPASPLMGNLVRVWKSTFLVDDRLGHKSPLIHAENITFFPYWTQIPPGKDYWFTLVFSGLPKECRTFDLREMISSGENGFLVENIRRNSTDIYRVRIH